MDRDRQRTRRVAVAVWTIIALLAGGPAVARADQSDSAQRSYQQGLLAAGDWHTCVVTATAEVRCWGADDHGQLGDGDGAADRQEAAAAVGLNATPRALTAGGSHTCALLADNTIRCWGADGDGQLGDGFPYEDAQSPAAAVDLGQPARAVAAGERFTCAILADGAVRCWGDDSHGALGNGAAASDAFAPSSPVPLGQPAQAISAGRHHACALLADGSVRCWGSDESGQLGDGGAREDTQVPSGPVALGGPARAITAGGDFTCALLDDGAVRCWGYDGFGSVGDGDPIADALAPSSPIAFGQPARSISAGQYGACALLADSTVRCWGGDNAYELGDAAGAVDSTGPAAAVELGQPARGVVAGQSHRCALLLDGSVRCWGADNHGGLGDAGTSRPAQSPSTPVAGITVAPQVADLSLTIAAPARTVRGEALTLTVTLANRGPDTGAAAVALTLPAGLAPVDGTQARWDPGPLSAGASATLAVPVRADGEGARIVAGHIVDAALPDPEAADDAASAVVVVAPAPSADGSGDHGADEQVIPPPRRRLASRLTLTVAARHHRRAPFSVLARGALLTAPGTRCAGSVTVKVRRGGRVVSRRPAALRRSHGTCGYTARIVPPRPPGRRLSLQAVFAGSELVLPAVSPTRLVRAR